MFKKLKQRREDNKKFIQKQIDKLISDSSEIRKKRIESRAEIAKILIQNTKNDPCNRQTYKIKKMNEFVSDENKSLGVKRIIAIWISLGYVITNMVIMGLHVFPTDFLFRLYLIFAFVSCSVILSYFYTSYKMNNLFKI